MKSGISSLLLISYEYFNITTSSMKSHAMLGGLVDDKLDKLHPKSKGSTNYHFQPIILFTPYLLSCCFLVRTLKYKCVPSTILCPALSVCAQVLGFSSKNFHCEEITRLMS